MANVVFLWHMHQPYYVNPVNQTAMMPWVRLHCVKGYLDMISVIEDFPEIHPNFNLTPVLLLQIRQLLNGEITDLWLEWSRKPAEDLTETEKFAILEHFFKLNRDHQIRPYPRFLELLNKRGVTFYPDDVRRGLKYFSVREFRDLQVWFNLAWCGFAALDRYPELKMLREKGRDFTEREKDRVLAIHREIMALVLRKYGEAETRGQVELNTTPFYHPILPLIYDTNTASRNLHGRALPPRFHWPQDAESQLEKAVELHEQTFGFKPRGMWPPEGAVAPEIIPIMERVGLNYFCTDEENLFRSLENDPYFQPKPVDHLELFQSWQVECEGASVSAIFREKPLSDFIGFTAARNEPKKAAAHLVHHLRHIADLIPRDSGLIPLILDGENAWQSFADGGEAFLRALYGGIASNAAQLNSVTIERHLEEFPPIRKVTTLHTGSWISGNFDTWIGEDEENRAWELLGKARTFLQKQIDEGRISQSKQKLALEEIYAAEGSDWFWWYGPDFSTENDILFDDLFRQHLKNVYLLCNSIVPVALERPIVPARTASVYTQPMHLVSPEINGKLSSYFEWFGAGSYFSGNEYAAMYDETRLIERIHFGFDDVHLFIRVDFRKVKPLSLAVVFFEPEGIFLLTPPINRPGKRKYTLQRQEDHPTESEMIAMDKIMELAVPLSDLGLKAGDSVSFEIQLREGSIEREVAPLTGPIQLTIPTPEFVLQHWVL